MRENRTDGRQRDAVLDMERAREAFGIDLDDALALTRDLLRRRLPALDGPMPDWEALHAVRGCAALLCRPEAAARMAEQERRLRAGGLADNAFAEVLCELRTLQHDIEVRLRDRGNAENPMDRS